MASVSFDLTIDGRPVEVVTIGASGDGLMYRLHVKIRGAQGGPSSQHDVPQLHGAFRIGGHDYRFTDNTRAGNPGS